MRAGTEIVDSILALAKSYVPFKGRLILSENRVLYYNIIKCLCRLVCKLHSAMISNVIKMHEYSEIRPDDKCVFNYLLYL